MFVHVHEENRNPALKKLVISYTADISSPQQLNTGCFTFSFSCILLCALLFIQTFQVLHKLSITLSAAEGLWRLLKHKGPSQSQFKANCLRHERVFFIYFHHPDSPTCPTSLTSGNYFALSDPSSFSLLISLIKKKEKHYGGEVKWAPVQFNSCASGQRKRKNSLRCSAAPSSRNGDGVGGEERADWKSPEGAWVASDEDGVVEGTDPDPTTPPHSGHMALVS